MPKKRQIPFLHEQTLADGTKVYHWKPSPRLRKANWVNRKLGSDHAAAIAEALDLNRQLAAWEAPGNPVAGAAPAPPRAAPRIVRVEELVRRYKASDAFTRLKPGTRDEYEVRLRQIEHWAIDGALPARDIDKPMVEDLKRALLKQSKFKAASILRVLRILLNWAVGEEIVATNRSAAVEIPTPPARRVTAPQDVRAAIAAQGGPIVDLAQQLGFWTFQRAGDLLALNRFNWREMTNMDARDAALLANPKGRVLGFRLQQNKTDAWVDAPVPPQFHAAIEAAFAANQGWLFGDPQHPGAVLPYWGFNNLYRESRLAAADLAEAAGNDALAAAIRACQFRDLRRTGMMFARDAGASDRRIAALSGHSVFGGKTILDTYMPGDTAAAAACVAAMVAYERAQQEREQQA
jgi:hypothetical protein